MYLVYMPMPGWRNIYENLFTRGKVYECVNVGSSSYRIICNENEADATGLKKIWVPKELFITLEQYRDNQIDELCK